MLGASGETGPVPPSADAWRVLACPSDLAACSLLPDDAVALDALSDLALGALSTPETFTQWGLSPPRGALLTGPPGTGKTLLAGALAARLGLRESFLHVKGGELLADGAPEAALRALWRKAAAGTPSAVVSLGDPSAAASLADPSASPSIRGGVLFLDDCDALLPARGARASGDAEVRLVASLLALMDGLTGDADDAGGAQLPSTAAPASSAAGRVFVLGATSRPSALDAALRRPGRFDREIVTGVPTASQRVDILGACLRGVAHGCSPAELRDVAVQRMHGFVGADVAAAVAEASFVALRRWLSGVSRSGAADGGAVQRPAKATPLDASAEALRVELQSLSLGASNPSGDPITTTLAAAAAAADAPSSPPLLVLPADLLAGLRSVTPSALREVAVEAPETPWSAIAGQAAAKAALREAIEWPALHARLFARLGVRAPRGVLLYGPPGCSKTLMARAMATGSASNFIAVKGPELFSMYVGDSEKAVARVFARARAAAPCVVFFDEFDSLGAARSSSEGGGGGVGARVVAQLLQELDGVAGGTASGGAGAGVVVVAATNRPDLIDPALLRPGRIDTLLYVGLPDGPARSDIAAAHLARVRHADDVSAAAVAAATEGYSGAETVAVLRDASLRAVQDALASVHGGGEGSVGSEGGGCGGEGGGNGSLDATGTSGVLPTLRWAHVVAAIEATPKQVTPDMLAYYATCLRGIGHR